MSKILQTGSAPMKDAKKMQYQLKNTLFLFLFSVSVLNSSVAQTFYLSLYNTQEVYTVRTAKFGKQGLTQAILAPLVLLQDSIEHFDANACDGIHDNYKGKIALINIGYYCTYGEKCLKAQQAGASTVVLLRDSLTKSSIETI